jgi:signal transduction histidine kinase
VAQDSGRALLSLINDILDLSKIEAHKITLENLNFDLPDTVDDIVQLMRIQASAKGLDFHSRVSPEVPRLLRAVRTALPRAWTAASLGWAMSHGL